MVRISRALIATVAAGLLAAGCSVSETQRPSLTGPSELALSLTLTANPDILQQDGSSQSRIVIFARDANANPIAGLPLHVEAQATISLCPDVPQPTPVCASALAIVRQGQLSTTNLSTASDGRATVVYTAPPFPPDNVDRTTTVTFTVTPVGSNYANTVPHTVTLRLVPPGWVPDPPVASFTYSASPAANAPVTFDGSGSSCGLGSIVSWTWSFGDNTPVATGVTVQHTYQAAGTYTVTLTVTDELGRTSSPYARDVTVAAAQQLTASFYYSPLTITHGVDEHFTAEATVPTGRTIADYAWNFGNGTTAHGITVTMQYAAAGSYYVTLTVTDNTGQIATSRQSVTVQ